MDLQQLADRIAIEDLLHRYAQLIDTVSLAQVDAIVDLFAADGRLDESVVGVGPFDGHAAIRQSLKDAFSQMSAMFHATSNLLIDFKDAATAASTSSILFEGATKSGAKLRLKGIFTDALRKSDGRWKFQTRKLSLLGPIE